MIGISFWIIFFIFPILNNYSNWVFGDNSQAPAKVKLELRIFKFAADLQVGKVDIELCVDKHSENRCFWTYNSVMDLAKFKKEAISYSFLINDLKMNLSVTATIVQGKKEVKFHNHIFKLRTNGTLQFFEVSSLDLKTILNVNVTYRCDTGYHPPRQCSTFCVPILEEYECDEFGNKKCKEGLHYDSLEDKCIANNCIESKITCSKNGNCINKGTSYECKCMESHIGRHCEIRNPCFPNPCRNQGVCTISKLQSSFECACSHGFTGETCKTPKQIVCNCPENSKCDISNSEMLCVPLTRHENQISKHVTKKSEIANEKPKYERIENSKDDEWYRVSLTTTIIAAIGCVMFLLCILISIYVFFYMKKYSSTKRRDLTANSPSTVYTHISPKPTESTFKRSLSLEENSTYLPVTSAIFQNIPGSFTMGSSNGFSIHSNSYQDNPVPSLISYPIYGDVLFRTEIPCNGMSVSQNIMDSTFQLPPLPPRRDVESSSSSINRSTE